MHLKSKLIKTVKLPNDSGFWIEVWIWWHFCATIKTRNHRWRAKNRTGCKTRRQVKEWISRHSCCFRKRTKRIRVSKTKISLKNWKKSCKCSEWNCRQKENALIDSKSVISMLFDIFFVKIRHVSIRCVHFNFVWSTNKSTFFVEKQHDTWWINRNGRFILF